MKFMQNLLRFDGDGDKPVTLQDDVWALSVASYEKARSVNFAHKYFGFETVTALPEHRDQAAAMKTYYRDKIALSCLRGSKLSEYRRDLYELLTNDAAQVKNSHLGMIHTLPYFYAEDQARAELAEIFVGATMPLVSANQTRQLRPVRKINRIRRSNSVIEYWFSDAQVVPVCWVVPETNPLKTLVASLFDLPSTTIRADWSVKQAPGRSLTYLFPVNAALA